jgi:hypothetical protein
VGKTKRGTRAVNNATVQAIPPNAAAPGSGTPGSGGTTGADQEAGAAGPIFGDPDFFPQLTFIAQRNDDMGAAQFTGQAFAFHRASGCKPQSATSIEAIINALGNGTGLINRLRIVSHVFVDPAAAVPEANMMIPFLEGGGPVGILPALKEHFAGYAVSDLAGLREIMRFRAPGPSGIELTPYFHSGPIGPILSQVTGPAAALIAAVPTDPFGEPNDPLFGDFFKCAASKRPLLASHLGAADKVTVQDAYDRLLADVLPRLPGPSTAADRATMRDAVAAVLPTAFRDPKHPAEYAANVRQAIRALGGPTFASRLALARQRFSQFSKVDVRGCQVGRDPDFLAAIQALFGTSPTVRPSVSGPDWYQHYNPIGRVTGLTANQIDTVAAGVAGYPAPEIMNQFSGWADGFGINNAHLNAWTTVLGGEPLTFAALQWAGTIPSTAVPVPRLREILGATTDTIFARLGAAVGVPAGSLPTNAQLVRLRDRAAQTGGWAATLAAPVPAANLAGHFAALRTVYEQVDLRFIGGTPPNPVIPSAAPAGLTAAQLGTLRDDLRTFIAADAQSVYRPVKVFMDAARARLNDARGRLRLYLGLGLPLLLFDFAAANAGRNTLVMVQDTGTNPRQDDAIRLWIRAQWQGLVPDPIGVGADAEHNRHTPWLVHSHQDTLTDPPFAVSPTPPYHSHIVVRPA